MCVDALGVASPQVVRHVTTDIAAALALATAVLFSSGANTREFQHLLGGIDRLTALTLYIVMV